MLRLGGFAGIAHETLNDFERPIFVLIFAAMMGLADLTSVLREFLGGLGNRMGGNGK